MSTRATPASCASACRPAPRWMWKSSARQGQSVHSRPRPPPDRAPTRWSGLGRRGREPISCASRQRTMRAPASGSFGRLSSRAESAHRRAAPLRGCRVPPPSAKGRGSDHGCPRPLRRKPKPRAASHHPLLPAATIPHVWPPHGWGISQSGNVGDGSSKHADGGPAVSGKVARSIPRFSRAGEARQRTLWECDSPDPDSRHLPAPAPACAGSGFLSPSCSEHGVSRRCSVGLTGASAVPRYPSLCCPVGDRRWWRHAPAAASRTTTGRCEGELLRFG